MALIVSAALGPYAGRAIDRFGGRPVLIASNLVFAAGLAALGWADSAPQLFLAWALMGIAMGSGLYEAAFATVVRLHGQEARSAITGITLFAGFASTVGWPLSAALESHVGWRGACMAWAGLHLLIGLPLNACLPRLPRATAADAAAPVEARDALRCFRKPRRAARPSCWPTCSPSPGSSAPPWPRTCRGCCRRPASASRVAVTFAALVGPAQVAGRVLEFTVLQRFHPLLSARLAAHRASARRAGDRPRGRAGGGGVRACCTARATASSRSRSAPCRC